MKTKFLFLIFILNLITNAYGACKNDEFISRQALLVSMNLNNLYFETELTYPHANNFLNRIKNVELDAMFLHRITRNGAVTCWQTKSNYSILQNSSHILQNYFIQFSSRRNIEPIENDWKIFIESYKKLEIIMQNAREK